MALSIYKEDRETAKLKKLYLFQIAVDGKFAETDRGRSEISGACTKKQARKLRKLIRTWNAEEINAN